MSAPRLRYAIEQRLRLIDFLLAQYGYFNRSALTDYFGISLPQAALDIADYMVLRPSNTAYDARRKCYVRTDNFTRHWA